MATSSLGGEARRIRRLSMPLASLEAIANCLSMFHRFVRWVGDPAQGRTEGGKHWALRLV